MTRAVASFDVTGWEPSEPETTEGGFTRSEASVRKRFDGDLVAESDARVVMLQVDVDDLSAGASYVASEVVTGALAGRRGTFAMFHWGLSGGGGRKTGGNIVPGSGTDELEGLEGSVEISVDGDGGHTLTIDYELPDE
ncbi:DUF3224 domain-containing protein [Candidatus Palauibacter sp.]|uniref:DUF3224 domain-containing protein n=1 Tax=Candidatus Palauibacter sp. TaxID=3101350 RepID=UPI003B01D035